MIQLTFYLEPVGKARARTTFKDGKAWAYTPDKTAYAESMIKAQAISWLNKKGVKSFPLFDRGVPLHMTATFVRSRPKSLPKSITEPVTKPDLSNYIKLLEDSLIGVIFDDDSQIISTLAEKEYAQPSGIPRIEVSFWEELPGGQPVKESRCRVSSKRT